MGHQIACKFTAMSRSEGQRSWSWGTLYAEHDNLTFDAVGNHFAPALQCIVQQHRWSEVTEVRWRPGFPFGVVEIADLTGVQVYRCFGAKRLARMFREIRARTREPVSYPLAA